MMDEMKEQALEHIDQLSSKDKLYIILLMGLVLRASFVFTNFDATVYQMWLQYFLKFGSLPYFDHPPVFFHIAGGLIQFFKLLQEVSPYLYWYSLIIPFIAIYQLTRDRSRYLCVLLTSLLLYVAVVGYLGNEYEIGMIASVLSGTVFIYISYLIGNIFGERTGLYASLLTAFAWWPAVYSSTLLIDMFAATVVAAAYYAYYQLLNSEEPDLKHYLWAFILLTLAFYTKYYSLLIVPAITIYAVYKIKDLQKMIKLSIPGIFASLVFLIWAFYTDFYFLSHYASTHYQFLTLPSPLSFGNFLFQSLTPLLFLLMLFGAYKLKDRTQKLLFLFIPLIVSLSFHAVQVFLLQRSHSLINLTNYMLYCFPFIAAAAAFGWENISIKDRSIVTLIFVLTLVFPMVGSSIHMGYDSGYNTPTNNLNTLSVDQIYALGVPVSQLPTLHYEYNFDRNIPIWSDYDSRKAHFRWLSPTKFKIVALEPTRYRLFLEPLGSSVNATMYKDGVEKKEVHLDSKQDMYVRVSEGITVYEFRTNRTVPFVGYKRNCNRYPSECSQRQKIDIVKKELVE